MKTKIYRVVSAWTAVGALLMLMGWSGYHWAITLMAALAVVAGVILLADLLEAMEPCEPGEEQL